MILPASAADRHKIYRNIIRECEMSREERRMRARAQRTWLLTGSESGQRVRYNKLLEHVQNSKAYLYAPSGVRFGVELPEQYGEEWDEEEAAARRAMHKLWHETEIGLTFGAGVTWAHAWDTAVFKVYVSENRPRLDLIPDPGDVGVWQEDVDDWDTQEAIVHWHTISVERFARMAMLRYPNDPARARALIDEARSHATPGYDTAGALPPAVERVILASANPQMVGVAAGRYDTAMAVPQVRADVVPMAELWIKDDAINDYRVATNFLSTETILWDPVNPLNPGEHPFHPLSIGLETPGYIWNVSPMEFLLEMEQWYTDKLGKLDLRDDLQLDPPIFFENMPLLDGEKAKAFRRPGGNLSSSTPNAKATRMAPENLPDQFGWLTQIDGMFSRMGGLPKAMQGQGESASRSGDQDMARAALASGPSEDKAMTVERCIGSVATSLLRLERRLNATPLKKADRSEFLLSQMPGSFTVSVWAHSHSPIYRDRLTQKATIALQAKAIAPEDFLLYLDLPNTDALVRKARHLEQAQAERAEKVLALKEREVKAKELRAAK